MIDAESLRAAIAVLEAVAQDRALLSALPEADRVALVSAAGRVARPDGAARRRLQKAFRRKDRDGLRRRDEKLVMTTGMRSGRRESAFTAAQLPPPAPAGRLLEEPRACYICKTEYRELHDFYDALCPSCAALNYQKRLQTADLRGHMALVTGGRIKIGYQTALILLRAGARVIVTTRFPQDASRRFAREPDHGAWVDRLELHGLDLRHAPSVEIFAGDLARRLDRLDILINNAAQTVRRPPAYYAHLLAAEDRPLPQLTQADALFFPQGMFDADEQQLDLRPHNSWRMPAADVPMVELLEVHLVNAIAPFLLTSRLRELMTRGPGAKHVIQVSAMEAQFARKKKTDKHPHTNMAKASLNMLTRTSAVEYAADGIYMNSVDTGWITDEDPLVHVERKQRVHGFHPPLDALDGAARVLDPMFTGVLSGHHPWGLFFKDYRPTDW